MTEWQVFGVIAALVTFMLGVVSPIIKLNTSITSMSSTLKTLTEIVNKCAADLDALQERNAQTHQRIFDRIDNHETRITVLEHDARKGESK